MVPGGVPGMSAAEVGAGICWAWAVATKLNIAPSQHTEETFKRILGGAVSVVEGIGSLRNKIGDAHGHGKRAVRPSARHAQLAVNLAGTIATFIVETWNERNRSAG